MDRSILGRTPTAKRRAPQGELFKWFGADCQESQKDHTADRFIGVTENLDDRLKKSTVGLVTLSDFQKTRDDLEEQQRQLAAKSLADKV